MNKVLKFGGSSVGTVERVENVIKLIRKMENYDTLSVVVSAFSGVTDQLINLCELAANGDELFEETFETLQKKHLNFAETLLPKRFLEQKDKIYRKFRNLHDVLHGVFLLKELSLKTLDYAMSFGEWLSCFIITEALIEHGENATFIDARKLVKTNNEFGVAKVNFSQTNSIITNTYAESEANIFIITGFCGSTEKGETTTLGRSGSDYTAAIFGAALSAPEISIYTDVDGVMTADPRKVDGAFSQAFLTYEEAMEMSHFGAKVIHPPTMLPAMRKQIPIRILNTFHPEFPGTLIGKSESIENSYKKNAIKGVTTIADIALFRIEGPGLIGVTGSSMRIFQALANRKVNIILITQASSEHSICFAVPPNQAEIATEALTAAFQMEIETKRILPPIVEKNLSIIAIVGENMRHTTGISGKFFNALGKQKINVRAIAQGSSELNISAVIAASDRDLALRTVHNAFFDTSNIKIIHLLVVGVGLVGSELIQQISENTENLYKKNNIEIKVIALANSRKILYLENNTLENWQGNLQENGKNYLIENVVDNLMQKQYANCIFVDCTASESVPKIYTKLLKSGIAVVTANKKGASENYQQYCDIYKAALYGNTVFKNETNVGAALPIIGTLQSLIKTGDEVLKIEAVLSGTLSYIFNTFDGTKSFSEVVKHAQLLGYTEPDPRDDLNGMDVARKLLILARETGLSMEMDDIKMESLLSKKCLSVTSVEAFFSELENENTYFSELLKTAQKEQKRLRFIAKLLNGKATIALEAVDANHPFYNLSGSDNIVSIYTKRYSKMPLVIKGAGAGASVTAAGVFANLLSV